MPSSGDDVVRPMSRVRWVICSLVFAALTVNYMDRNLFANLVPFFEDDLKLGPTDIALLNVAFILPYGYAMIFVGRLVDRIGIKKGLMTCFGLWSIASILHAAVWSLGSFLGIRFLLGLGEAGMYPSAVKTTTEWFPQKERGSAVGFFNAGSNIGAILAPTLGILIAYRIGWKACFLITGVLGLIWFFFWQPYYRSPEEHPGVTPSELAYIKSDGQVSGEKLSFQELFAMPAVYGLALAKALTDAPVWFIMLWMPKIIVDDFHMEPSFLLYASPIVYIFADLGSLAGGWASSGLLKRGWSVGPARKIPMLVCASLVVPVMAVGGLSAHPTVAGIPSVYVAVALIALAFGAHQGWSCNLFTLIADTVPAPSMALAVGAINGFAMVGVAAFQFYVGRMVQLTSSYKAPFMVSSTMYLIALLVLHIILPKVEMRLPKKRANLSMVITGGVAILVGLVVMEYLMNKPPYRSIDDYTAKRSVELDAVARVGPKAKVGWMDAQWYSWTSGINPPKLDLVKLDTNGRPYIETKGVKAAKYKGPSNADLAEYFHIRKRVYTPSKVPPPRVKVSPPLSHAHA